MRVLLLQENQDLGMIWCRFLCRQGLEAVLCATPEDAINELNTGTYSALVLDPVMVDGAIGVADLATYRNPDITIIAVTTSNFFSDGAMFELLPSARGVLRAPIRPSDLAAYLEHYTQKPHSKTVSQTA